MLPIGYFCLKISEKRRLIHPPWCCRRFTEEVFSGHCFLAPADRPGANTVQPYSHYNIAVGSHFVSSSYSEMPQVQYWRTKKRKKGTLDKKDGMYGDQTGVCHGKLLPGEVWVIGMCQSRGKWVPWGVFSCCARGAEGRKSICNPYLSVMSSVCTAQGMEGCSVLQARGCSSPGLLCAAHSAWGLNPVTSEQTSRKSGYGKEGGGRACWAAGDQGGRGGEGGKVPSQGKLMLGDGSHSQGMGAAAAARDMESRSSVAKSRGTEGSPLFYIHHLCHLLPWSSPAPRSAVNHARDSQELGWNLVVFWWVQRALGGEGSSAEGALSLFHSLAHTKST